ncbi:MAG: hypothetical protein EXS09_17075 [Gemmataceae bacterium]|nr:hypothetical protein [Gemmataceae bacterium]
MNDQGTQIESEFVFRRLVESFKLFTNKELSGSWWLLILSLVLIVGIAFIIWMYIKDARAVRWHWALPLATLRILVYLILALMFLMPAKQGYERVEKHSRVLIVIDVSDSMSQVSDDVSGGAGKPHTRLNKVMDYLSDEKIAFVKTTLEKNPVYIYRAGNRLDEEAQQLERGPNGEVIPVHKVLKANGKTEPENGTAWQNADWQAFAAYDFKPWLLRGLSDDGASRVKGTKAWDGNAVGNAEWAVKWHDTKEEATPGDLSADDAAMLNSNRDKILARVEVARSIASATNIPDSMLALINRETGNMVRGIVVFSDGQSNLGNDAAVQELRTRTERDLIPIFTVVVGSEIRSVAVRITDVITPDQTPPDEPFKVIVEQDGDGLVGQKSQIFLEIKLPKDELPVKLPIEVVYQPGEPPHAQAEFIIDPEKVPEQLKDKENPKELANGEWRIRAVTPRVEGERFTDKEHVSEWVTVKVQKKAARVLIVCSAPTRDVQFLLTQMLRDKADVSLYVQNTGGTKGEINLLEEKERQLTHFPDRLNVEENPTEDVATKWYNLARYDVVIAFDFDWEELTIEQTRMVQAWVDLQAGGLLFVAGQIYTKHLARPDPGDKFRPIIDILPVLPGDPDLAAAKRTATLPWRIEFENLSADLDFMKLDDAFPRVDQGWEMFFTGRDERDDKARMLRGFYNYFPLRDMKPVATPIARFPDPNAIKMPDGKSPPWIAVMQYGQGRTGWVGSPEIWRLRQYKEEYFERFWTKFTRYLAAGSRRKQTRRGRILMSSTIGTGGYIRVTAQVLDPSLQPAEPKTEPKITFKPVELDKYPPEIDKLTGDETIAKAKAKFHEKFTYEFRMSPKKGPDKWEGYFQRAQLASVEKFPPGSWKVDVEIPSSTDTLKQKFMIRQSNPELDVTRPDVKAMYQLASAATLVKVPDKTLESTIKDKSMKGADGARLCFKFGDEESLKLIPQCIDADTKTSRNRGAVEDYWDKGVTLPSFMTDWMTEKPQKLAYGLMLVIGLLSIEWLTRKLLKLA